jgi:hypothetical protein
MFMKVKRKTKTNIKEVIPTEPNTVCQNNIHEDLSEFREEGNAAYCGIKCEFYQKKCALCTRMFTKEKIVKGE